MGSLGSYLSSAREARGMDLHEAAQATRISVHYLKAMEEEDFSRLPGEVFVRGFLKSYAKFLNLSEPEVMRRYQELQPPKPSATADRRPESGTADAAPVEAKELPLEPLVWGGALIIALIVLLFVAVPGKHVQETRPEAAKDQPSGEAGGAAQEVAAVEQGKLYLEIIAREDVWLLVRTDASPQKKAVLKKGESVIWSADERFLLSYGSIGAVTLLLNGNELIVKGPGNAVVRDLVITSAGIAAQKVQEEQPKPKPRPAPVPSVPQPQPQPAPAPPPEAQPAPQPAPAQQPSATRGAADPAVSPAE